MNTKVVIKESNVAELSTFWKLLENDGYIKIPIIQRDYAQGRNTPRAESVREAFLLKLFEVLFNNAKKLHLDFIYGIKSSNEFIPFDGQQRLTTLYLLHWYFALYQEKFRRKEIGEVLSRFSYYTRDYATDFCKALTIDFIFSIEPENSEILSTTITNLGSFFSVWKTDPTVQAMLVMIDDIHNKFKRYTRGCDSIIAADNALDKLFNGVISFYYLSLGPATSDNIYVKMNARGRALTHFENFKAELLRTLEDLQAKETFIHDFSEKLDTEWTDLFWIYREKLSEIRTKKSTNNVDEYMMNFIKFLLDIYYVAHNNNLILQKYRDTDSGSLLYAKDNYMYLNEFQNAVKEGNFELADFEKMYQLLNVLYHRLVNNGEMQTNLDVKIDEKIYFNEGDLFVNICRNTDRNNKNKLIASFFYEVLVRADQYTKQPFSEKKIVENNIGQWARIISNIVENNYFFADSHYSLSSYLSYLKASTILLNDIEKSKFNIIEYLSNCKDGRIFGEGTKYEPDQVLEECIKAKLIKSDPCWLESILSAEKHPYLNGKIGFMLEASKTDGINYDISKFNNYVKCVNKLFGLEGIKRSYEAKFRAALLCYGDYRLPYKSYDEKSMSGNKVTPSVSWKALMQDEQRGIYLQKLLSDYLSEGLDLQKVIDLNKENVPDGWRRVFIENPDIFNTSLFDKKHNYITREYGKSFLCSAYSNSTKGNAYTSELFLWNFYYSLSTSFKEQQDVGNIFFTAYDLLHYFVVKNKYAVYYSAGIFYVTDYDPKNDLILHKTKKVITTSTDFQQNYSKYIP